MANTGRDASTFVIFGGTGDLSRRKLLPALARLGAAGDLHEHTRVLAVGRSPMPDAEFRGMAAEALRGAGIPDADVAACTARLHYHELGDGTPEHYRGLARRLDALGREHDIPPNRAFYMSLPPRVFPPTVEGLGAVGLNASDGWTRLIVEKPFGRDLASARELNALVRRHYREDQVYRIDHYLGKETVQNLLVFRLANAFMESAWNRERVEAVQITVGEDLGVGTRAQYYDRSGALRDMVQNHLTQLLTLVAMEVPASFSANAIRHEKIKVLHSIAPICCDSVIRGQYTAGEIDGERVRGYLEEDGVAPDSGTETFVAMKVFVDSWRWQGVPFYLRSGKRLPGKSTQIAIRFRGAPVRYFERLGCKQDTSGVLIITLQPNEGFTLYLEIKAPGSSLSLKRIPLHFSYGDHFHEPMTEAYQTLILDVLEGDQTLFVHRDEVEESWRVYTPLLENPPAIHPYPAGTWGPPAAESLAIPSLEDVPRSSQ